MLNAAGGDAQMMRRRDINVEKAENSRAR